MLGFLLFLGHDPDDVAFACVEVHFPGVFPTSHTSRESRSC